MGREESVGIQIQSNRHQMITYKKWTVSWYTTARYWRKWTACGGAHLVIHNQERGGGGGISATELHHQAYSLIPNSAAVSARAMPVESKYCNHSMHGNWINYWRLNHFSKRVKRASKATRATFLSCHGLCNMPQLQHTEHSFIACFEELSASAALF